MKNTFIFIGMSGVGKSTFAKQCSKHFAANFVDIDDLIESKYNMRLHELIDLKGEKKFKQIESQCVLDVINDFQFIAPGGSFVYDDETIQQISDQVIFIYLHDLAKNIYSRIPNIMERGIIGLKDKSFEELYHERCMFYYKYADFIFDLSIQSFDQCAENIIQLIELLN